VATERLRLWVSFGGGIDMSKAGRGWREGRRGGEEDFGGTSGSVMDGAGLGDGMVRKESRDKRRRSEGTAGVFSEIGLLFICQ